MDFGFAGWAGRSRRGRGGGARRGKSELRRAGWSVTPTRR